MIKFFIETMRSGRACRQADIPAIITFGTARGCFDNMSRIGYDSSKYYEEKKKLPLPDGINCIICGKPFERPDKRKSYCSQECFSKWYYSLAVDSWERIKAIVLKRDGKCLKCGVKIGTKKEEHYTEAELKALSVMQFYSSKVLFEVHHIIPICEGGDEFDPKNCMTECYDCHKEEHTIVGKHKRANHSLIDFHQTR